LVEKAYIAASEFPEGAQRDRYLEAAASLRLPYWDWAKTIPAGDSQVPIMLTEPNIVVQHPDGQQEIPNPLFPYKFQTDPPKVSRESIRR
jgi:tyrosinase